MKKNQYWYFEKAQNGQTWQIWSLSGRLLATCSARDVYMLMEVRK